MFWAGDLNYRINGNRRIVEETVKQGLIEVSLITANRNKFLYIAGSSCERSVANGKEERERFPRIFRRPTQFPPYIQV